MIIGFSDNDANIGMADRFTKWFTQQPYTHTELFIEPHGLALSARTDGKGVSLKPAKPVLERRNKWAFFYVPTANPTEFNQWVLAQVGKKYDYADLVRMVSPISVKFSDRWFCSELCYVAARDFGTLHIRDVPHDRVHPGALFALLIEAGAKQIDAYSSLIAHEK